MTCTRPTLRTRTDEELIACAGKGGIIAITAVPNSLSDDPAQDINCVLDHYDYMVRLVGIEHVAIGTDMDANFMPVFADYADWPLIPAGLLARGLSETEVAKVMGGNFLRVLAAQG